MTFKEWFSKTFPEKRLNKFSYFSGWHENIEDVCGETWNHQQERINELKEESEKFTQAFGWLYAEACSTMDKGCDIRKKPLPILWEQCLKDLEQSEGKDEENL